MCAGPADCGGYWCEECVPEGESRRNQDGSVTIGTAKRFNWKPDLKPEEKDANWLKRLLRFMVE